MLARTVRRPDHTEFEIRWPNEPEMRDSARLLLRNGHHGHILTGVFTVLDGGYMPCATYTDPDLQNAFWEDFTQCDEVTNLFVWNFYGEIIYAAVYFPGC